MRHRTLLTILMVISLGVSAQDMPPKVEEILRITMAADGFLSGDTHKEFWDEIDSLGHPKEVREITVLLRSKFLLASEYQKEVWTSAKVSSLKGRVMKSQRTTDLETEYPKEFKKSFHESLPEPQYQIAAKAFDERFEIAKQNTSKLLLAAANKSSMTSAQGEKTPVIDLYLIETSLSGIALSFSRLTNLLNRDWKEVIIPSGDLIYMYSTNEHLQPRLGLKKLKIFMVLDKPREQIRTIRLPNEDAQKYVEKQHKIRLKENEITFGSGSQDSGCGKLNRTTLTLWFYITCFRRSSGDQKYYSFNYQMEIVDPATFEIEKENYLKSLEEQKKERDKKRREAMGDRKL